MTTLPNQPTGYVFLDVDGIINPFDRDLGLDGWKLHSVEGYQIWVGKPLKPWFKELVDRGVQIVWATTWINTAPGLRRLEKLWGLPADLPTIDKLEWNPGMDYQISCGKRPGVNRHLIANKIDPFKVPSVWVDDHLSRLDMAWAVARGIKTVKVPSDLGLADPKQIQLIEDALFTSVTVAAAS